MKKKRFCDRVEVSDENYVITSEQVKLSHEKRQTIKNARPSVQADFTQRLAIKSARCYRRKAENIKSCRFHTNSCRFNTSCTFYAACIIMSAGELSLGNFYIALFCDYFSRVVKTITLKLLLLLLLLLL